MHILRTARCFDNVWLLRFDSILRDGLISILNVSFTHSQWQRASLPVKDGGLGVRTAYSLASSAFLASAVGTLALQNRIVPRISELTDTAFEDCLAFWSDSTSSVSLTKPMSHERLWGAVVLIVRLLVNLRIIIIIIIITSNALGTVWLLAVSWNLFFLDVFHLLTVLDSWPLALHIPVTGWMPSRFSLAGFYSVMTRCALLLGWGWACHCFSSTIVCAAMSWTRSACMD